MILRRFSFGEKWNFRQKKECMIMKISRWKKGQHNKSGRIQQKSEQTNSRMVHSTKERWRNSQWENSQAKHNGYRIGWIRRFYCAGIKHNGKMTITSHIRYICCYSVNQFRNQSQVTKVSSLTSISHHRIIGQILGSKT